MAVLLSVGKMEIRRGRSRPIKEIASHVSFRFVDGMQLELWRQNLRLVHTWTIARGSTNDSPVVLCRLTSKDGVVGLGEASPISRYHESIETVEQFLSGLDAQRLSFKDVAGSMAYVNAVAPGNMSAKCAVNIALLDGADIVTLSLGTPADWFRGLRATKQAKDGASLDGVRSILSRMRLS